MLAASWLPDLSVQAQAFVRTAYGLLLLATLLWALPHGRRFFLSERWGGYAESHRWRDVLHSSAAYPFVIVTWALCAVLLVVDRGTLPAALVNVVLCRHYFIRMRWKGVLRGMGAPGFMTYWLGVAVLLLEVSSRYAPSARPIALLALQLDLALIFLSAGLYKVSAGFARNDGMELGLANPAWGYWWRYYRGSAAIARAAPCAQSARVVDGDCRGNSLSRARDENARRPSSDCDVFLHRDADPARVPVRDGDDLRRPLLCARQRS